MSIISTLNHLSRETNQETSTAAGICSAVCLNASRAFFFCCSHSVSLPSTFSQDLSVHKCCFSCPVQWQNYLFVSFLLFMQANKNLDMSINASNNFNLNITWSFSSTGRVHVSKKQQIPPKLNVCFFKMLYKFLWCVLKSDRQLIL